MWFIIYTFAKGKLISKANWRAIDSPKKRTDEFDLFAFLLFTANKSNSSVCFLGESTAHQSAFWFYLTFSKSEPKILCLLPTQALHNKAKVRSNMKIITLRFY